ncbi:hypothetical protein TanjilG_29583 [Lupinus angustifolius]|uniref:RIN4 pathogenic type III effector avirulence factor Avr cleavage site domain-containing protein n=1 Tax=Lupinus angustifolius TaxID=3871 RepID=A0A4P1R5Q3_LUPAN|nr:PREDICTED: uncharacterized protein LOC109360167 [Lupinus angustifolius]XP_019460442.1 PREDICTED: uncharacterized protein LOC109360167 [Lupinus angustifolius]OIW02807.1 hypothetical protein TanjilG_29583 [Lupinus angustifolius]
MEQKGKKPITSVPQFGGWDQNAAGATDYSMVFTQARANKKHMKTDLTEVKRISLGNEHDFVKTKRGHSNLRHAHSLPHHHRHHHAPANVHDHTRDDPVVIGKRRILTYINCCIRP